MCLASLVKTLTVLCFATFLAGSLLSCKKDEKSAAYQPAQEWNNPQEAPSGTNPHAGNPHALHGGQNPHTANNPHAAPDVTSLGLPPPDPNRTIDTSKFLRGTITGDQKTTPLLKSGSVVFLSVKRRNPDTGQAMGPPIAVEKLTLAKLPMPFVLTEKQAMISGTKFVGDVVITAWTDQDADAMTKQSGDIFGSAKATIPSEGIQIVLDAPKP